MSESTSEIVTTTAPALIGVWVHDPLDVEGTLRNFIHAEGRTENRQPRSAVLEFIGREDPVIEFGEITVTGLQLTVVIPSGSEHDAGVDWWVNAANNRRTILYRDNRGRLMYAALADGVAVTDERAGSSVSVSLRRVSYAIEV
jgi:hypothetical protein